MHRKGLGGAVLKVMQACQRRAQGQGGKIECQVECQYSRDVKDFGKRLELFTLKRWRVRDKTSFWENILRAEIMAVIAYMNLNVENLNELKEI